MKSHTKICLFSTLDLVHVRIKDSKYVKIDIVNPL